MQPSSDHPEPNGRSSALRRFGPLVAIAVVIAVVIALVVAGGDDDEETAGGNGNGAEPAPTGAIPFDAADDDATFQDGCDLDTGRAAIPFTFAAPCFVNQEPSADYEPPQGVTEDTVKIVQYVSPDVDPILDFITGPINVDDTPEQQKATIQGYADMFNDYYQTYGRRVEIEFVDASGASENEVAARADAQRVIEEIRPFAVLGGPVLAGRAWAEEMQAAGIPCLGCGGLPNNEPYNFSVTASGKQTRAHVAEYISKKLLGKPAEHAGDEAMHDTERVFGQIFINTPGSTNADDAELFRESLADLGVELAEQLDYQLDPGSLQEQAASVIARLKSAGVTTVVFVGDPIAPATFTQVATQQDYFPEWVLAGSPLVDITAFGRTYDQEQWSHAFGISSLGARVDADVADTYVMYRWYNGEDPPAMATAGVLYPNVSLFFAGLQVAGPDLTADRFRDGLFNIPVDFDNRGVTSPFITFGDRGLWDDTPGIDLPDYNGIDDFTELWWDPTVEGDDEIFHDGVGMYRYVDGGKRYFIGDWPEELKVFDLEGTSTVYTERPPGEEAPDYPPPG